MTLPTQKKPQTVWSMFDRISPSYDFLNRLLSGRQDVAWRNKMASLMPHDKKLTVLDLATGTADVAITLVEKCPQVKHVLGLDMAEGMLAVGRQKVEQKSLKGKIALQHADACQIPAHSETFDVVTMAFGIRNVEDPSQCLHEMARVLKPGGNTYVLEFSLPRHMLMKKIFLLYFRHILPVLGGLVSRDMTAYRYLNRTVETFPYGEAFCDLMRQAGFKHVKQIPLTFGIATIYVGER